MRLTSFAVVTLFIFLSYKFSEPLGDYKGRFIHIFEQSAADSQSNMFLGRRNGEKTLAQVYNMAAIRDANLIIYRALTDNALNEANIVTTPRS